MNVRQGCLPMAEFMLGGYADFVSCSREMSSGTSSISNAIQKRIHLFYHIDSAWDLGFLKVLILGTKKRFKAP